jgi:tRNA threonylcarbamoyladenosine biosynthesis protein TsaE
MSGVAWRASYFLFRRGKAITCAMLMADPDVLLLPDLAATEAEAARFAAGLRPGDAVLLEGELGAGKTAFVRAVLRGMTGDPCLEVPSPSYTLVQSYDTPAGPVHHFDLWRLSDSGGLVELGWEEARDGIVLVEWPDRLGALTPANAMRLQLSVLDGECRALRRSGGAR